MALCPNCGEENPARARLCMMCGTSLVATLTTTGEERKLVSILFVDLVGFTERSNEADPEDVRAVLAPYHARLKREIERFGGSVEKFIGDAVMAVFGAPVAHEDDAERAVRAALRATEAIAELNQGSPALDLHTRAAVNTGEALVALGARPESGETLVTGDVVNTASRLQQVAPVDGVAVGETTYRATRRNINYQTLPSVNVKGKPHPLAVWKAVDPKSRYGVDLTRAAAAPFVGRDRDLDLIKRCYSRAVEGTSAQLLTITGEPGVGKSRLVSEFFRYTDDLEQLVTWRQGRSLPYGEGVAFWALGEIVKAETGILESDTPGDAAAKLKTSIGAGFSDATEREWVMRRLIPLVGAQVTPERTTFDRTDSFAAWRRYLETLTGRGPLVLVFEDLHWADPSLLDFVEDVVSNWSRGPLLMLCTARPELYERHPSWEVTEKNRTTLTLTPLSDAETTRLLGSLLPEAALSAELRSALLERAKGNPLFAEEFAGMLQDKGDAKKPIAVTAKAAADVPLPDTLHALIAARLDKLPPEPKRAAQSAAVAGKVFWSGAVAALDDRDPQDVQGVLTDLAAREFVLRATTSSILDEQEYAFRHALIRDVAYTQLPRAIRAQKHVAMARWLEAITGERLSDHADALAHHYLEALSITIAMGATIETAELTAAARRFLLAAGDRAMQLDVAKALLHYQRALELSDEHDPDRVEVLDKIADASVAVGAVDDAEAGYREVIRILSARGDLGAAGEVMAKLARTVGWHDIPASRDISMQAVALLEPTKRTTGLVRCYVRLTADNVLLNEIDAGLSWSEKASALLGQLADVDLRTEARTWRGVARMHAGDPDGIEDVRQALDDALAHGSSSAGAVYGNLALMSFLTGDAATGLAYARSGEEFARRRGWTLRANVSKDIAAIFLFELGEWDEALDVAQEVIDYTAQHGPRRLGLDSLCVKARVLLGQGKAEEAGAISDEILPEARAGGNELQLIAPCLVLAAEVARSRGDHVGASAVLDELVTRTRSDLVQRTYELVRAVRVCADQDIALAGRLISGISGRLVLSRHALTHCRAMIAEAGGELSEASALYVDAADRWAELGLRPERGHALLGAARALTKLGRGQERTALLQEAQQIFRRLRAAPLVAEVSRLQLSS